MSGGIVAGIFVGGRATRMGGRPKGLLRIDGETLVERWIALLGAAGVRCVLVGAHDAYAGIGVASIADRGVDLGPLGGLLALLDEAGDRDAISVACDMPYVGAGLLARLIGEAPDAPALAPRRSGRWEPFFARWRAPIVRPIADDRARAGRTSLQGVLDRAGARELALDDDEREAMRDWDAPEDVAP